MLVFFCLFALQLVVFNFELTATCSASVSFRSLPTDDDVLNIFNFQFLSLLFIFNLFSIYHYKSAFH